MASQARTDDAEISDINIVPLVDIILVVLIIFMVTAPALIKPSLPLDLPVAASGESTEPSFLQVAVTSDGRILINNQEVDEESAKALAKAELDRNPLVQAVISADQQAFHRHVVQVMDWLKKEGVQDFAVTTEKGAL